MTIPVQNVYRDFERTESVDTHIPKHMDKLGTTHAGHVVSCRVAIEAPHKHKQHGRHFRVPIDMTLPGAELVVDRNPDGDRMHEDAYAAIDDAFDHAVRRVVEYVRRARELAR